MQAPYLAMLAEEYGKQMNIIELPLLAHEVKGVDALREVERVLFG